MRLIHIAALVALSLAACGGAAAQASGPQGVWITASRNFYVAIAPCGGDRLCGDVSQVLANNSMERAGPSKAPPLAVGARLVSDLRKDGRVWRGRIFNRENGRTYDCVLRPMSAGAIELRAYVVFEIFGQSQIWTRADAANVAPR